MDKYCTFYAKYLCNLEQYELDFCSDQFWPTPCNSCPFCKEAHHG